QYWGLRPVAFESSVAYDDGTGCSLLPACLPSNGQRRNATPRPDGTLTTARAFRTGLSEDMDPQSRITVVCGKGGVGKTTVSLALGLKHANRGRRVVIVSSHPLPELAIAVSLEGIATRFPVAAKNLFVVHLDPREMLQDIVKDNFPMQMMADAILNSSIFRNLVEVAPGLKEFYFLTRLQELAERKAAPAGGHFLTTLRAARAFDTFLSGPLAAAGAEMDRFFSNSANMEVLAVTPLEEMAITETIEMSESLKRDFQLRCSALILNLVSP